MPNAQLQKLLIQLGEWQRMNPSTVWRRKEGMSRAQVSALSGVSYIPLREYEAGRQMPTTHSFVLLARIMGRKPEMLKAEWDAWVGARPRAVSDGAKDRIGGGE